MNRPLFTEPNSLATCSTYCTGSTMNLDRVAPAPPAAAQYTVRKYDDIRTNNAIVATTNAILHQLCDHSCRKYTHIRKPIAGNKTNEVDLTLTANPAARA